MATLAQIRERAAAARKRISAGAQEATIRARSFGRAVSSGASKQRASFCARTTPPPAPAVVKATLDRAMARTAAKLGYKPEQLSISNEDDAVRVSVLLSLKARTNRLARQAYEAAMRWRFWLAGKSVDDLRDTYRYAQNALDEAK